jgi:DnaJ-class molecular chaperone
MNQNILRRWLHRKAHRTLYEVLGVDPSADAKTIKSTYYQLSFRHHPDRHRGNGDRFRQISEAYHVLGNTLRRRDYDRTLGKSSVRARTAPTQPWRASTYTKTQQGRVRYNLYEHYRQHFGRDDARRMKSDAAHHEQAKERAKPIKLAQLSTVFGMLGMSSAAIAAAVLLHTIL